MNMDVLINNKHIEEVIIKGERASSKIKAKLQILLFANKMLIKKQLMLIRLKV